MICPNCVTELEPCDLATTSSEMLQCLFCGHAMTEIPIYHDDALASQLLMVDLHKWVMRQQRDTTNPLLRCVKCDRLWRVGALEFYLARIEVTPVTEVPGHVIAGACPECKEHFFEEVEEDGMS